MSNEFAELDELMGLDDDAEFGLDDDEDELGLDEEAEFGLEDEDEDEGDFGDEDEGEDEDDFGDEDEDEDDFGADDDDMEDMKAMSDDPEDPEDDSGPDINDEQFGILGVTALALSLPTMAAMAPGAAAGIAAGAGALTAGGLILARSARYRRQQRIFRNRYKRAVKRADWRRKGAGVRRRLKNTYRRMKRLWAKVPERKRAGLKNPARTRKDVVKLYGPLPRGEAPERRGSAPVYPTAGIAAGLVRPPSSAPVPPLSQYQSHELNQQALATNYAQRFSSPPVRSPQYVSPLQAVPAPSVSATDAPALAQLDTMTNDRLWNIAAGKGIGFFSTPAARMRARQILRARGISTTATNSVELSVAPAPSSAASLDQLNGMTNERLWHIASGQGLGIFSTPAARMQARQILRSRGVSTAATNPAASRPVSPVSSAAPRVPLLRPNLTATFDMRTAPLPNPMKRAPVLPRPAVSLPAPPLAQRFTAAARPEISQTRPLPMTSGPMLQRVQMSPAVQAAIRPGFSPVLPRFSPGARSAASANMGFDTYGIDAGAVAPIVADGYSVVPDFSTLGMSAIKEHPIKSVASIAGLFAAGVLLAKPVGDLIRSRVG